MKIVVLTKEVPDTYGARKLDLETGLLQRASSEPVPDEIDERALEHALLLKDSTPDTEIVLLSMAPEGSDSSVRKLLAMGADSAVIVSDEALGGSDMVQTARVLAAAIERIAPELVVAGAATTDGGGAMVPAMIAESIGKPLLPGLDNLDIQQDSVSGTAQVDGGWMQVSATLPAVVSVTEKSAEARFPNFKGIRAARKKSLDIWNLADLGIAAGPNAASVRSVMVGAEERPQKQAGPKVIDDGTAAQQLTDYLISNKLL